MKPPVPTQASATSRNVSEIVPDVTALKALAHPVRLRMLGMLRIDGPATATQLAARLGPAAFAALMQRFFRIATDVFTRTDAVVDKMVGDEVIGIYLPGFAGSDYRQHAIKAALSLLHATGHGDPAGPWLSIGVGVHAGRTFVGSIGVEDGNYQFAALGDPMNFCARLVAAAKGGEVVISTAVWEDALANMSAERRSLTLKGYDDPVDAYVATVFGRSGQG